MYREKKFWDIYKTADKAWIPYITYIKIENDKSANPTISNVVKIARALRVSIDDLTKYSFWEEETADKK